MSTDLETKSTELTRDNRQDISGPVKEIRKTVVVIDQDTMYRGHLRELIEREGYDPQTFSDAYQMVRHVEKNLDNIKAVFIDAAIFAAVEETLISLISNGNSRVRLILTDTELPMKRIRCSIANSVYGYVKKPYCDAEIAAFLH